MAKVLNAFNTESNTIAIDSDQLIQTVDKSIDLGATTNVYSTVSLLPTLAQAYSKALVTDTNTLYQYNGGWYPIALINNFNPAFITEPNATYALNSDGSATTVTVLAADSDDVPIVYSVVTDSDFNQFATCTHDSDKDNVWTITPSVSSGDFPAGTVTFRASDGVNLANVNSEFSIDFGPDWSVAPTESKLTASDTQAGDGFGTELSISSDGTYAMIGAPYEDGGSGDPISNAGAAYVFTRSGSTWTQQARLAALDPSDAQANDYFGNGISLSSDGTYAIISASGDDGAGANAGAAYIFTRSGSTWTQQQKLTASDAQLGDYFGHSVSINSDATYAIVGAWAEGTGGATAGSAYVFVRSGSTWTQQQKIQSSDIQAGDKFGQSVSISSDGTYAIVGAEREDGGAGDPISDSGAAYIFTRSGSTWTQQAKLFSSSAQTNGYFGWRVSISGDGTYAIVAAKWEHLGAAQSAGAAYIFTRSGSTWTQQQKLTASDAQQVDEFGASVSMSSNGTYAIVGANGEDGGAGDPISASGAAYVFERSGSTWTEVRKLNASDAAANDYFGNAVTINTDGKYVIVGASQPFGGNGATYIYEA